MPNYHSFIQQILIMKVIMVNAVDGSAYFLALWIWQVNNKQTKILTKELMITTLNT